MDRSTASGVPGSHTGSAANRCTANNRHGERCRARAIERGLCAMHSGKTDPRAMGRAGGLKVPETELRKAVREDDRLRESAREVIRRGLDGDDSITKTMLDAARSVFSFRAAQPPTGEHGLDDVHPLALKPKGEPTSFAAVFATMLERCPDMLRNPRWHPLVDEAARLVAEFRAEAAARNGGEAT
jgi:hypothetical protein